MRLPVGITILVLAFIQHGCASLAAELVLRTLFFPLDLALKENTPTLPTEFQVVEDVKRSKKDWLISATSERYSFLSHRSRPAYGLRLGYYIEESHSLCLSFRMIQDRKISEAAPFGEAEHKFRVQTTEFQYAYHYGFAFMGMGAGWRNTSLTTRSRATGEREGAVGGVLVGAGEGDRGGGGEGAGDWEEREWEEEG